MFEYSIIKNNITKFNANYIYNIHSHNHYEIILLVSGQCMMSINDQDVVLNESDCIIINKNVPHNFYVNGVNGCRINQLQIDFNQDFEMDDFIKVNNPFMINTALNNIFVYQSEETFAERSSELVALEAQKILILFQCMKSYYNDSNNLYVQKAVKIIKDSFAEDVKCKEVADKIGVSERYLRKMFEEYMGISPKDYITNLRIEKAKNLLVKSDHSIAEIASIIGYNTIQYFSEIFKTKIGITPTEFRLSNKSK